MSDLHLNINLNFQQLVEIVKQLSPSDKLKLNEVLWSGETEIPSEHQNEVLERIQKSKNDPSRLSNWDEASKKLKP